MRLVRPIRRCKTRRVSDRSAFCTGVLSTSQAEGANSRATSIACIDRGASGASTSWAAHGAPSDIKPDHQNTWHQIPRKSCERSHTASRNIAHREANLVAGPHVTRREMATAMPARDSVADTPESRVCSSSPRRGPCVFGRCVRKHAAHPTPLTAHVMRRIPCAQRRHHLCPQAQLVAEGTLRARRCRR